MYSEHTKLTYKPVLLGKDKFVQAVYVAAKGGRFSRALSA